MLGIVTAVPEELESVSLRVENKKEEIVSNIKFVTGEINDVKCVVVLSGAGKINAAKATQLMICKFGLKDIDNIINIGTAGATHPSLEIGDVVIASKCSQHDVDVTILNESMGMSLQLGQMFLENDRFYYTDSNLRNMCKEVMNQIISSKDKFKVYEGVVVTGDKFENSPEKKLNFYKEFGALCDDMEGAAVVKTANDSNVPSIVIRSISDKPKKEEEVMYAEFSKFASERAVEFLNLLTIKMRDFAR